MAYDPWASWKRSTESLGQTLDTKRKEQMAAPLEALKLQGAQLGFDQAKQGVADQQALRAAGAQAVGKSPLEAGQIMSDAAMQQGDFSGAMDITEKAMSSGAMQKAHTLWQASQSPMGKQAVVAQLQANGQDPAVANQIEFTQTGVIRHMPDGSKYVTDFAGKPSSKFIPASQTATPAKTYDEPFTRTEGNKTFLMQRDSSGKLIKIAEVKEEGGEGGDLPVNAATINAQLKPLLAAKEDTFGTISALTNVYDAKRLIDQGMITGTGAEVLTNFGNFLSSRMGFKAFEDPTANAQAFSSTVGNQVGQIIKQFGSGTGLSDADREYAQNIVGGNIKLNEKAIRKLLDINERYYKVKIREYQNRAAKAEKKLGSALIEPLTIDYTVQDPNVTNPDGSINGDILSAGDVVGDYIYLGESYGSPDDETAWQKLKHDWAKQ